MFKLQDFWDLIDLLKDGTNLEVDSIREAILRDEKSKTLEYFENVVDQYCFSTNDYYRLKNLIVDWYSSQKSLITISRNSTDVFSLPVEYLDELFRSFGYDISLDLVRDNTKPYFFLDLVNLYKIKGTPLSIYKSLGYYGLDVDISEYWLTINSKNDLVFRSEDLNFDEEVYPLYTLDTPFSSFTTNDPHWIYTEDDIRNRLVNESIKLPSKSPYFSIRSKTNLTSLNKALSILFRIVEDDYYNYKNNNIIKNRNIKLKELNIYCNILELYITCLYLYNYYFTNYGDNSDLTNKYLCYNESNLDLSYINTEYTNLLSRSVDYDDVVSKRILYLNNFNRILSSNFLLNINNIGDLLYSLNATLKLQIDEKINSTTGGLTELYTIVQTLSIWIKDNLYEDVPLLSNFIFGYLFKKLYNVIDFFKPYHSRLVNIYNVGVINDPLHDTLLFKDYHTKYLIKKLFSFDTADSTGIIDELDIYDSTNSVYSRKYLDFNSYFDIGSSIDNKKTFYIYKYENDLYCDNRYNENNSDLFFVENLETTNEGGKYTEVIQSGGFMGMDEGGYFDLPFNSDVAKITINYS